MRLAAHAVTAGAGRGAASRLRFRTGKTGVSSPGVAGQFAMRVVGVQLTGKFTALAM
ncbi:hypothetical protein SAMN05421805_12287 [Saccharopolyspora antimicrobica]|uniref:Uncharacterized protein n=1 Tax=Saccharopolyspora antimicrobica TaxID=455193 RepID=A0A1I5JFD9_9PSEU|nr:hypothetical protein ATL45_0762 [Saccharopolyspora antimicrobica]SFO71507.1 hypothetical protein SAMN05421805_12287 [Saccharopolyspora antimicrobica]